MDDVADEQAEAADAASRPLTRTGRRARAVAPERLSPGRALAGAAVSVAGVLLGIGTLLWVSDDPSDGPGPVVQEPPAQARAAGSAAPDEGAQAPAPARVPLTAPTALVPPSSAPRTAAAASPAVRRPVVLPVTVLNNSRLDGLAERAAARFRAGGWPVRATGNFRGRIPSTTVYHEPGQQAAARAFAQRFRGVVRVRPRFPTLPARGLVVVVTRDFEA